MAQKDGSLWTQLQADETTKHDKPELSLEEDLEILHPLAQARRQETMSSTILFRTLV